MSYSTTIKDTALLTSAAGSVIASANYLTRIAPRLDDEAVRDQLEKLAATLQAEAAQLQHIAWEWLHARYDPGRAEPSPNGASHLHGVYDQRMVQDRGADNIKWYNPFTTLGDRSGDTRRTKKIGICFHHTGLGTPGGFGVHGTRQDYWRAQDITKSPSVPQPNGQSVQTAWVVAPSPSELGEGDERSERWSRAMALADRYRGYVPSSTNTGVPYHAISATNGVLYLNLDFEWVTWHGSAANNDYLGFAWDGDSTLESFDHDDMLAQIKKVISIGRDEGHFASGVELTGHCAWGNKPPCPGKEMVQFLCDIARECEATIRMDFKADASYRSFNEILGK